MIQTTDSDACVQIRMPSDLSNDQEREHKGDTYQLAQNNAGREWPDRTSTTEMSEYSFFDEAFMPNEDSRQCDYPWPDAIDDHLSSPYPSSSTETNRQDVTSSKSTHEGTGALSHVTHGLIVSPVARHQAAVYANVRDDSGLGSSISSSQPATIPYGMQINSVKNVSDTLRPLQGIDNPTPRPIPDPIQDDSSPYVAGTTGDRQRRLEQRTDALAAIADLETLFCDKCGKACKDKPSLSHHRIIHDGDKTQKYKCTHCGSGFRYPKDLRRHIETVHGGKSYPCPHDHCNKVYKRKDHLERHMKSQRHVALSDTASTSTTDWQDVSSSSRSDVHRHNNNRGLQRRHEYLQTPTPWSDSVAGYLLSDLRSTQLLPSQWQVPRLSSGSAASASLDDNATVSDVDSFPNEPL